MTEQETELRTQRLAADAAGIAVAAGLIQRGGCVALPTETVYGLAGDATSSSAVAAIYAAKGRPSFNPLIVHVATTQAARALVVFTAGADALAAAFWPGPLTLVLPARADHGIAGLVQAGLTTLAVRVPAHPAMQAVLRACNCPLAAPSANASGYLSPTTAEHVLRSLDGRIAAVVDGGACPLGLESTIIGFDDSVPVLLRAGALSADQLAGVLKHPVRTRDLGAVSAPGQLPSHYAPRKPLRLSAVDAAPDTFLIGFGDVAGDVSLSPAGDVVQAAANLFACLYLADASSAAHIAVAPIPGHGLGAAINDRLARAAYR